MEPQLNQLMQAMAALGIGLLIGLEREYGRRKVKGKRLHLETAGIRTFALVSLTGNLLTWLPEPLSYWAVAAGLLFTGTISLISYQRTSSGDDADKGTTSEFVLVTTYLLGALTGFGYMLQATIVAVIVFALLYFKKILHTFSYSLSESDLRQTIQFLVVTVVVLPILPDEAYGPYNSFNPWHIWLMIVLISGIGFASYASMKLIGHRAGLGVVGILGGLTSSTAVTLAMSRLSSESPKIRLSCMLAIILACSTMFPRTLILTLVLNPEVTKLLILPFASVLVVSLGVAALLYRQAGRQRLDPPYEPEGNPLSFKTALAFGGIYAMVIFFIHMAQSHFGDTGLLTVAALSGLSDIDPVTLSLGEMSRNLASAEVAAQGILLAAAANSLVKFALSVAISPASNRVWLLAGIGPMILISLVSVLV